ncbi:hypothetical protein [Pedobacter glucosidilyticus]|uniref:hypothetical protein n=1 Tax=Pedobacter glucosidilyticus TaxID=1122941 RepID=UPI0006862B5F
MKYDKLPITVSEQIEKLKGRNLKFDNETKAQNYLTNISYYRLRAYTYPFQDNSKSNQPLMLKLHLSKLLNFMFLIENYVYSFLMQLKKLK